MKDLFEMKIEGLLLGGLLLVADGAMEGGVDEDHVEDVSDFPLGLEYFGRNEDGGGDHDFDGVLVGL